MPRRTAVDLEQVASLDNLALAFHRAARGKRAQAEIRRFALNLPRRLSRLRSDLLDGNALIGGYHSFRIRDPKPRTIHAPRFEERVIHHALIEKMAPGFERALVDDSYACRTGKGTLAAVHRAQHHVRRYPWYVKVDIRRYFASIDHEHLRVMLRRRFKGAQVLGLCDRIVDAFRVEPGKGLPIGALSSQYFANHYLAGLDRYLLETLRVPGMVRYMDDVLWWCHCRQQAHETLDAVQQFVAEQLGLVLRADGRIQRSSRGVSFLGIGGFAGTLQLSRRRRGRYARSRQRWEQAYLAGVLDSAALQARYASALGITAHADSLGWRKEQLRRHPTVDA